LILLIDLDGTLLFNSMDKFQPSYFKALGAYLEQIIHPDRMLPALIAGTRKMLANDDPLVTLESAFDQHFYPALGLEKAHVDARIMEFYEREFPALGSLTHQFPEAIDFVRSKLSAGDRIVVATNPLFPRVATLARLAWAGLPADRFNFDLITTYEFMHFSKPHPEYFAEILAYLGYPDEGVIMIGNDLKEDIHPAGSLGIPGFWLTISEPIQGEASPHHPSGDYHDLVTYLESDFEPNDLYATCSIPVFMTFLNATLAALHGYQLLGQHRADQSSDKLSRLISERMREERALIESSPIRDKLTLNIDPSEGRSIDDLSAFARYRLAWKKALSSLEDETENPAGSDLCSLLQTSVANDRKMLIDCTQWLKALPEITNHPG
jgi:FMN phosphatase YigB (HAD superfamily)